MAAQPGQPPVVNSQPIQAPQQGVGKGVSANPNLTSMGTPIITGKTYLPNPVQPTTPTAPLSQPTLGGFNDGP